MAKVDGPLLSIEARGKIADAIVFFPWKGRHVVRQWLKPTNKKSTIQGFVRAAMIAIGKFIKKVQSKSAGDAVDSKIYSLCTAKSPAGMNWNAFLAGGLLARFQLAGTFVTGSFTSLVAAYSSITAAVLSAWGTDATLLGMADTAFSYGYTVNMPAGLQLFMGAAAAYYNSIQASAPYSLNPVSWVATDINIFKTDLTNTD